MNREASQEALKNWKLGSGFKQQREIENIRRFWNEGLTSGPSRFVSMADLKAEARHRSGGNPS